MRPQGSVAGRLRRAGAAVLCVGALGLGLVGALGSAAAQTPGASTVRVLTIEGVVDPFVADYLQRGIRDATAAGDAAVLIQIDTSGGLDSSMREVTQSILNANVPIIGYVAPEGARAVSAGAYVLMSTPIAAMAPSTSVGVATPVGLSGATGSQSAMNDDAAYMQSLAQHWGRNADVAATFVTQAASITADQALHDHVVDIVAPSQAQVLTQADGRSVTLANGSTVTLHTAGATIDPQDLGGLIGFLHQLINPSLAFVFFWLGLALIVLEVLLPGHIVSGTLGVILLILAVVSFGLLPVRLVGIFLLLASAVALVLEARHPGLGIWGALGLIFLIAGGWFLYNRAGGTGVPAWVIAPVAALVGVFFFVVVVKARKLRDLPPPAGPKDMIGQTGVALGSGLTPHGVVRVSAEEWRATSSEGTVPGGNKIVVVGIDGLVLTVEPAVESLTPEDHAPVVPAADEGKATR